MSTLQGLIVEVTIRGQFNGDDGVTLPILLNRKISFSNGTGNNQLSGVFLDKERRLNATNEDFDLSGGSTKGPFGDALAFPSLKVIFFENLDSDTGDTLIVKQPAANGVPNVFIAASDGVKIPPNGLFLYVAPGPDSPVVTAGTGDLLNAAMADDSTMNVFLAG